MGNLAKNAVVRANTTLTRSSTGWTTAKKLPQLGTQGLILSVSLRMSASGAGTAATLYVGDDDFTDAPDDLDVAYESASISLSGSATAAELRDALSVPAPYSVGAPGDLQVNANITAGGAGASTLNVTILAEVFA